MNKMSFAKTIMRVAGGTRISYGLLRATLLHRRIEREFRKNMTRLDAVKEHLSFTFFEDTWAEYFQHNFFSIFFLSVYQSLGIPLGRIRSYGIINHTVRGIVTAADNVIDGEEKGAVKLQLKGGSVLRNVFLVLMQDDLLHEAIKDVAVSPENAAIMRFRLLETLFEIALEESSEEKVVEEALPVEKLLREIHYLRGGRLLELAFVAPQVNEPALEDPIRLARKGIHSIGMGLQIIDDITDFAEDLQARNYNLLRSWIVTRRSDGAVTNDDLLSLDITSAENPETFFPNSVKSVLNLAIDFTLDGFEKLQDAGYSVNRHAALRLTELLFRLRGLEYLWNIYSDKQQTGGHDSHSGAKGNSVFQEFAASEGTKMSCK